jgi:hypothetical protein
VRAGDCAGNAGEGDLNLAVPQKALGDFFDDMCDAVPFAQVPGPGGHLWWGAPYFAHGNTRKPFHLLCRQLALGFRLNFPRQEAAQEWLADAGCDQGAAVLTPERN